MNTTVTHPVAPEDVMAWLDDELAEADAQLMAAHVTECPQCAEMAEEFGATARAMAQWTVAVAPKSLDAGIAEAAKKTAAARKSTKLSARPFSAGNWRMWTIGGAGAIAGVLALALLLGVQNARRAHRAMTYMQPEQIVPEPMVQNGLVAGHAPINEPAQGVIGRDALRDSAATRAYYDYAPAQPGLAGVEQDQRKVARAVSPASQAPMIARTVALTIRVKDVEAARTSLDAILARSGGYAASLTINTPQGGSREFQASLRIPAPQLAVALAELKAMGPVLGESQAGEEVTAQHADLTARLQNGRETEQRLRAILEQRTGKIEDVLQVEQEIARVRGEIEQMEAEQKALEHRVAFASVELHLGEEFREQLAPASSASTSTRLYNALITGLRNAADTVLGIVLFFSECGPSILVWLLIFGTPVFFIWRRYRKIRSSI